MFVYGPFGHLRHRKQREDVGSVVASEEGVDQPAQPLT